MKTLKFDYTSVNWDAAKQVWESEEPVTLEITHFGNTISFERRESEVIMLVDGFWTGWWRMTNHPFSCYHAILESSEMTVLHSTTNVFPSVEDARAMIEALPDSPVEA